MSVGWHPSGQVLALGSARGLVTLVSVPQLQHLAELRAHLDEVRAVAFTPSGESGHRQLGQAAARLHRHRLRRAHARRFAPT